MSVGYNWTVNKVLVKAAHLVQQGQNQNRLQRFHLRPLLDLFTMSAVQILSGGVRQRQGQRHEHLCAHLCETVIHGLERRDFRCAIYYNFAFHPVWKRDFLPCDKDSPSLAHCTENPSSLSVAGDAGRMVPELLLQTEDQIEPKVP